MSKKVGKELQALNPESERVPRGAASRSTQQEPISNIRAEYGERG